MDFEFENEPESDNRRKQMNQESSRMSNLVDTTDCLEAISIIKFWKNFLFVVILLALILVQGSFWVMNLHLVRGDNVVLGPAGSETTGQKQPATEEDKIKEAITHLQRGLEIAKAKGANNLAQDIHMRLEAIEKQK